MLLSKYPPVSKTYFDIYLRELKISMIKQRANRRGILEVELLLKVITIKNKMQDKTYPYTFDQLRYFEQEIKEAGGVDELMLEKEALVRANGMTMITNYRDIEGYRQKYLIGIYESLRTNYDTEVPYVFWSRLYEMLKRI